MDFPLVTLIFIFKLWIESSDLINERNIGIYEKKGSAF